MFTLTHSWSKLLEKEFDKPYMQKIEDFLQKEIQAGKTIYPEEKNILKALNTTDFDDIKVVIIGQDPYHREGQAHGLSFSVQNGITPPPSLKNIYKEIESDTGHPQGIPLHGNLEHWAKQGVLLLNACLTVEKSKPASHSKIGWQNFTDKIIAHISDKKENVVFLLWGAFAQGKKELIDLEKHLILEATHPSPFSAYKGFFGCKHFSKTNDYLITHGKQAINWSNKKTIF